MGNRKNKKGEDKRGYNNGRMEEIFYRIIEWGRKRLLEAEFAYEGNNWRITVYSQRIKEDLESWIEELDEMEEGYLLLSGDSNARTRNEGGRIYEIAEGNKEERRSVDRLINKEGRDLIAKMKERG